MLRMVEYLLRSRRVRGIEQTTLVNIALLALGQIGLNVAVLLASAVLWKWRTEFQVPGGPYAMHEWLMDYGLLLLVIPMIWTAWTIQIERDIETHESLNWIAYGIGWLIIIGWLAVIIKLCIRLFHLGCSFSDSGW